LLHCVRNDVRIFFLSQTATSTFIVVDIARSAMLLKDSNFFDQGR
jgi:hypothetical protein